MTINPQPYVMSSLVRHRVAELQGQAAHNRLAALAAGSHGAGRSPRRSGSGSVAIAIALALLLAGTVATTSASQPLAALSEAAASATGDLLAANEPQTSAVQKVREAAWTKATPKLMLGKITFTDILVS